MSDRAIESFETCFACLAACGQTQFTGEANCPEDGAPVLGHAKAGACPRGLYVRQNAAGRTPRKCGGAKKAADPAKATAATGGCGSCGQKKPTLAEKIAHGAVGLAKVGMQAVGIPIDQAPEELVRARLAVCEAPCGRLSGSQCLDCGCFVHAKARLLSEDCPIGAWPKPTPPPAPSGE